MRINIFHKLFLLSFLLFPLFAQADPCTVGKIAVIPGSWENTSTKTSLTVQAQTSAGESCHVPKTLKLSFSSTASGSFTAQGGGAIQAYISASDANRNFYYTHSAGENYTLTINADYGTASEWSTQFTTTYTSGSSGTSTTTEEEVPPTESEESSGSSSSSSSSHHSATPLSTLTSTSKFKVGAGRERLTHIGTPIELRAEVSGEESNKINFTWSLGDGSVLVGETVNHTYVFPGEYHVVLNATTREGVEAVSRTKVRVHSAEVSITSVTQERIEVTNNSPEEMNLYGRALVMQDRSFIFPKDTIVSARGRISFPSSVTKLSPQSPDDVFLLSHGQSIPTDLF
ncbi:MAG: PKD domain-containing protein, partial [Parcubacteria group bacterium]